MTPRDFFAYAKKHKAEMVDLKFTDWPGLWQHFSVPLHELEESSFEDGFGFERSALFQDLDAILDYAQNRQREIADGQSNFDIGPPAVF